MKKINLFYNDTYFENQWPRSSFIDVIIYYRNFQTFTETLLLGKVKLYILNGSKKKFHRTKLPNAFMILPCNLCTYIFQIIFYFIKNTIYCDSKIYIYISDLDLSLLEQLNENKTNAHLMWGKIKKKSSVYRNCVNWVKSSTINVCLDIISNLSFSFPCNKIERLVKVRHHYVQCLLRHHNKSCKSTTQ